MCMVVYLAADAPLPLISWDAQAPAFHVKALGSRDDPVRARFSKPHVYYVGSHEGCGCGFGYGQRNVRSDVQGFLLAAMSQR
jgi:hypothetical protein